MNPFDAPAPEVAVPVRSPGSLPVSGPPSRSDRWRGWVPWAGGEVNPPTISRRQALCRFTGGLAGAILATLGLAGGKSQAQGGRFVSLRALLARLSPGCNPGHGIRIMFPEGRGVISIRELIRRFGP
jgi:hypothetical protein